MIKKINLLTIVIILCVVMVSALALSFVLFPEDSVESDNEAQQLIADNNNVVKKAKEKRPVVIERKVNESDHYVGDLSAPVHIIEYSDFECPFCYSFSKTMTKVKEEFGDKVVIAFRHFPLQSHKNAIPAAIASECAGEQGKFWEMHDKLFDNAKNHELNLDQYRTNAEGLDLDLDQFDTCLREEKYKDKIISSMAEGKRNGVSGTPASFVNGEVVPGAYPFDDFIDSQKREREGMKTIILRHLKK